MSLVISSPTAPNRAESKNPRVWGATIANALWKIFTRFGRVLINFYQAVAEARLQREMIVAERYRNRYLRELGASLRSKISSKLR